MVVQKIRTVFDEINLLTIKVSKGKGAESDFKNISDKIITMLVDNMEVITLEYLIAAEKSISAAKDVFLRNDYYESDLIGLFLDEAKLKIRFAIYFENKDFETVVNREMD